MRFSPRWLAAPIAAAMLCAFAPAAQAAVVQFSVSSPFVPVTKGEITLSFAPAGQTTILAFGAPPTSVDLGRFTLTATDANSDGKIAQGNFTVPFSLDVIQTLPTGGNAQLTSTITGTITYMTVGPLAIGGGSLTVDLDPNSFALGPIQYVLVNDPAMINVPAVPVTVGGSQSSFTDIRANVTAVPLPGVAWAGIALLGGLGSSRGLKKLRRRSVA